MLSQLVLLVSSAFTVFAQSPFGKDIPTSSALGSSESGQALPNFSQMNGLQTFQSTSYDDIPEGWDDSFNFEQAKETRNGLPSFFRGNLTAMFDTPREATDLRSQHFAKSRPTLTHSDSKPPLSRFRDIDNSRGSVGGSSDFSSNRQTQQSLSPTHVNGAKRNRTKSTSDHIKPGRNGFEPQSTRRQPSLTAPPSFGVDSKDHRPGGSRSTVEPQFSIHSGYDFGAGSAAKRTYGHYHKYHPEDLELIVRQCWQDVASPHISFSQLAKVCRYLKLHVDGFGGSATNDGTLACRMSTYFVRGVQSIAQGFVSLFQG